MKAFKFQYETILRINSLFEKIKRKEFAVVNRQLIMKKNLINSIVDQQKQLERELYQKEVEGLSHPYRLLYLNYRNALKASLLRRRKELEQLNIIWKNKQKEFLKAKRKKEVFARLKELKKKEHLYLADREEQKILDDLNLIRFNNKSFSATKTLHPESTEYENE